MCIGSAFFISQPKNNWAAIDDNSSCFRNTECQDTCLQGCTLLSVLTCVAAGWCSCVPETLSSSESESVWCLTCYWGGGGPAAVGDGGGSEVFVVDEPPPLLCHKSHSHLATAVDDYNPKLNEQKYHNWNLAHNQSCPTKKWPQKAETSSFHRGVWLRRAPMGIPSHKIPHIKLYLLVRSLRMMDHNSIYLQVIPLCKWLCTLGWPTDRATIPVCVQQQWGILPSPSGIEVEQWIIRFTTGFQQTSKLIQCPWLKALQLFWFHKDRDKHLTPLVSNVITLGGTCSSNSLQLLVHLHCWINLKHTLKDGSVGAEIRTTGDSDEGKL